MTTTEPSYERRVVSVLFADLVGFTTLTERLEPEDVAAIQDRYFAAVREVVGHYLGVVEKFVGDAAMAAFGVPFARDDDAERATRCGLAIVAAVERLDAELGLEPGAVSVRVGIATGAVVHAESGPDAGRLTGDTVNTAARLQTAATPGSVLLSESTALAVAEAIDLGPAVDLELKGKAATVRARSALGARGVRSREVAMGSLRAPTLGRETQLGALLAALDRVATEGRSARWLVVAPPGTGKTRLLEELAGRVPAAVIVRRARFRAGDPRSFGAVSDLAASLPLAELTDRLADGPLGPRRGRVVAESLATLAAGSSSEAQASLDRDARFGAWLDGFAALAGEDTELWLVEDAHWAGRDALAFLDAAQDRDDSRRLVVATARPSLLEREPDWCATDAAGHRMTIDLPGLDSGPALALVRALVGDALGDELATRVADASDGNCLFIEELLRTWISTGILRSDGDTWRMEAPADEIAIPLSVHAVYGAQLDDLPPAARSVARRAAVAGRRFPVDALEELGIVEPGDALDSLTRRALISGPADLAVVGPGYTYRHALLRDAAYESLARSERASLHVALARWFEAVAGKRVDAVAEAIGDHYAAALAAAPVLGVEVASGLDRPAAAALAASWLERGAGRAMREAAYDAGARLLRRALELTPAEAVVDAGRRWLELGRLLRRSGDANEAVLAFERAIELARSVRAGRRPGDDDPGRGVLAQAAAELANLYFEQIRFVDGWKLAEGVLGEIDRGDDADWARLLMARARGRGGETNEAGPWIADARTALAIARSIGDRWLELAALDELSFALDEGGLGTEDDLRAVEALARELGDWDAATAAMTHAAGYVLDSRPAAVAEALAPAREIAETWALTERLGWILQRSCEGAFTAGNWAEAMALAREAVDLAEPRGFNRVVVRTFAPWIVMAGWRGDAAVMAQAQAWFEGAGLRVLPDSPYARVLFAAARIWFGRFDLGPRMVPEPDHLRESTAHGSSGPAWVASMAAILATWRAQGWFDEARAAVVAIAAADAQQPYPSVLSQGAFTVERALIEADGDSPPDEVAAIVRSALPILRPIGAAWWILRALRLLHRIGRAAPVERTEITQLERRLGIAPGAPGVD